MSFSSQSILAWNFDGTTTDYVTGLTGTVVGTDPAYVSGKYNQAISLTNPAGTTPTSNVTWVLPSISTVGFTVACWVNANTLPASGTAQFVAITKLNPESDLRLFFNSGTTNATIASTYAFASGVYIGATTAIKYNTGTWVHIATTITESSTGSNVISVYVNGAFLGSSSSATSRPRTFNKLTIGSFCDGLFGSSFDGLIDDLRIYNTALSAAQIRDIYTANGRPGVSIQYNTIGTSKTIMTGTSLFSQLSAAATSSSVGAFSLRAINGTTVKAVQVKRSSDSATQDFWADRLGNLLTAPVTGTPISTWLAGSTGNVVTWYDQSGSGKNMAQTTASLQPTINLTTTPASIVFTGNGTTSGQYFQNTVPFTFNFGTNYQYTIRAVVNNTVGGCLVYKGTSGFPWNQAGLKKWWLGAINGSEASTGGYPNLVGWAEGYVYGQSAITSAKSSVTWSSSAFSSVTLYENASSVSVSYNRGGANSDPGSYLYIGAGGNSAYYNGNVYEIEIFSSTLGSSDVTIMG